VTAPRRSKFQDLFDETLAETPPTEDDLDVEQAPASRQAAAEEPPAAPAVRRRAVERPPASASQRASSRRNESPAPATRTSRPPGKSSDPEYTPVTLYLKRSQYQKVQVRMIELGRKREISDLVGELLEAWLIEQTPRRSKS